MPTVDAIIQYGAIPEGSLVDEPNVLVQSLTITPAREKREFKGGNGAIFALQYRNPIISFAFRGFVSAFAGLANAHPGSEVTELANYEAAIHGFDPADGIMVYEDPSRELDVDNPAQVSFTVVQYPFVDES